MPKLKLSLDINLVPKDPFFETIIGKILKWSLSVGRYIVIFTELVVIVSFVTRFSLDRQVTDLNKAIDQKKNIILAFGDLDENFRNIQFKIDNYKQVEQQRNIAEVFPKLTEITPPNVIYEELTVWQDRVNLTGLAQNQGALNTLINNLQISDNFFEVAVEKIESDDEQSSNLTFNIKAQTKEAQQVKQAQ